MKTRLTVLDEQCKSIIDQQALMKELQLVVTSVELFAEKIHSNLNDIDWDSKRSIIRTLVKRVEIDEKDVNVVFKINPPLSPESGEKNRHSESLQHRCRRKWATLWNTFSALSYELVVDKPSSKVSANQI